MKAAAGFAASCYLLVGSEGIAAQGVTAHAAALQAIDARIREIAYEPQAVVAVPVKRGVVTLVVLDADEVITEVGAGLGGDCAKAEAAWCIAAQPGGRTLFIKPKRTAAAPNNLAVVTNRRVHNFRLVVLNDEDPRPPLYRLVVKAPPISIPGTPQIARAQARQSTPALNIRLAPLPARPSLEQLVSERLQTKPVVLNTQYVLAEGAHSQDIVPTLAFDDGRFTYLRFPGNREVPAVFHVLDDGSETLVNTRMEDDLLVVDRVSRRLMLRAGNAVVGLWNEAFDVDGVPPEQATTVPGLRRVVKAAEQSVQPEQAGLRSGRTGGAP